MNKFKILILIIFTLFLCCVYIFFSFNKNIWPFNSKMGYLVPEDLKYYIYKIITKEKNNLISDRHKLKIVSKQFPEHKYNISYGGGIDVLSNNEILFISNIGNLYLFKIDKKVFVKLKINLNNIHSVRDIKILKEEKKLIVLGVKKLNNNCGTLSLTKFNYNFKNNNDFKIYDKTELWESEENCKFKSKTSGGRIEFKDNFFYVSTGIFQAPINSGIIKENWSQKKNSSFGKIIKISFDGSKREVFSTGLRNPQGLFFANEILIATDHGPRGGDEINIIQKGKNYGWPCISYGILYDKKIGDKNLYPMKDEINGCQFDKSQYQEPLYAFSESVGISQGILYKSDYFKYFKNNLIIGSLKTRSIYRLMLNSDRNKIIQLEQINLKKRIRDLIETPDGKIIFISDKGFINILY